ncbi:hypothetical protein PPP05_04620, partial [Neisseria gonorrhoeae]|uniref:hypothetical protein n=1 Tax=Neisseria gonorrhoeae TaxID=485 RepID=UPI0039BEC3FD
SASHQLKNIKKYAKKSNTILFKKPPPPVKYLIFKQFNLTKHKQPVGSAFCIFRLMSNRQAVKTDR